LKLIRQHHLKIITGITAEIKEALADNAFKDADYFLDDQGKIKEDQQERWFRERRSQISGWNYRTNKLTVQPYYQVGAKLRDYLNSGLAHTYAGAKLHLKLGQTLREALAYLQVPNQFQKIREEIGKLLKKTFPPNQIPDYPRQSLQEEVVKILVKLMTDFPDQPYCSLTIDSAKALQQAVHSLEKGESRQAQDYIERALNRIGW
jgi:hypothetical protein